MGILLGAIERDQETGLDGLGPLKRDQQQQQQQQPGSLSAGWHPAKPKAGSYGRYHPLWFHQVVVWIFLEFSPRSFGKRFPFDLHIFFRWVGSTTNQIHICEVLVPWNGASRPLEVSIIDWFQMAPAASHCWFWICFWISFKMFKVRQKRFQQCLQRKSRHMFKRTYIHFPLLKTESYLPKRTVVFQPSIFRGYVKFFEEYLLTKQTCFISIHPISRDFVPILEKPHWSICLDLTKI